VDLTIAHISDMHAGSAHFVPDLMEAAIAEINALEPDLVIATGDFTTAGYRDEYEIALSYLDRIRSPRKVVVPGNADSRNVGYRHFEELMGNRFRLAHLDGAAVVAVDSSEPDLDSGAVGREWYPWILENFREGDPKIRIFVMHHHLLPVPGTGRDPSLAIDAGDLLEVLLEAGVDLVLTGHKHVPWVWRLEGMYVATAGTVSSMRLRGLTEPSYNVVHASEGRVRLERRTPGGGAVTQADWSLRSGVEFRRRPEAVVEAREPSDRT
jgi:3',5'-cyclic AMP phosphodiesterase CpdA